MHSGVAVTGIGVISALGPSREHYRDGLLSGASGITAISAFDVSGCRTRIGAPVAGFDAASWIPPMKLRRMDDTARYAVVVTRQAFEDAGYPLSAEGDDDAGVVLGTFTAGGQATTEYLTALHTGGPIAAPALLFNSTVANAPASLAGLEFKLRGPNVTISQKEASGLAAVATAVDAIRLGRTHAAAAGGVDAIFEIFYRVHDRFAVMSSAEASTFRGPFDRGRGGFVLGEGGYALLLEDEQSARARGSKRYGEILGVGAESTAVSINSWPASVEPLIHTMESALADAGLDAREVDVVYASANGTALDALEACALQRLFSAVQPVVTTVKGAIGEAGASGAAALASAFLCGAAGEVPPIAGLVEPDASAQGLRLARARTTLPGPIAMVNSFASGGSLFSVVLRVAR